MEDAAAYPLQEPPYAALDNGRFTTAIIAAVALHLAVLVIGLATPTPQLMGEETGSQEGLSVEIVDASELPSATAPSTAPAPSGQTAPADAPPPTPPDPVMQETTTEKEAAESQPAAVPTPPVLKPSTNEEALAPANPPPAQAMAVDSLDPSLFEIQPKTDAKPQSLPPAAEHKAPGPAKQPKAAKPEKPSQLSMTIPTPSFSSTEPTTGRNAGLSRPAGITRSGLNDEFGRGVIHALRQTMPPNNRTAQATVRFVLSADGNLLEVELVRGSGDAVLDQNVVFAVKQANFPIPATNLTALDRQFRVTYVYR